jgi:hypothetical protein
MVFRNSNKKFTLDAMMAAYTGGNNDVWRVTWALKRRQK